MSQSQSRKRKRPITSCSECYRRKQKCDREQPCAICTIRGIPEKCSFDGQSYSDKPASEPSPKHSTPSSTQLIHPDVDFAEASMVPPTDLDEQTGYSSANNTNFSILQKSLRNGEKNKNFAQKQGSHLLPDFVIYQISDVEKQLPSRTLQNQLLDLFFDQCWWWFTSLEPVSFRRSFNLWHRSKADPKDQQHDFDLRDHFYFSALLFQTLAVALQYFHAEAAEIYKGLRLSDTRSADLLSIKYSKAGGQIVEILGRHDSTVNAVQHDILKGIWLKNFSRGDQSWYSLGNAIRQAQELGLQRQREPALSMTVQELNAWLWEDLLSQRVWACLFSWDAHVAFTLGRPRIINVNDCARMTLVACDIPEDTTSHPPPTASEDPKPCLIAPIIFHYDMAYLIHEMLDISAGKPDPSNLNVVDRLHTQMSTLIDTMPPHYKLINADTSWDVRHHGIPEMRFHLSTIAQTYLVALHRAYVLRRQENCDAAITAAINALGSQERLFQITKQAKWRLYTYSFYTIDAAVFLAALLLEQAKTLDQTRVPTILEILLRALDRLEAMQGSSPMAKSGAQILRKCYDRMQKQAPIAYEHTTANLLSEQPHTECKGTLSSNESPAYDGAEFAASPSFRSWIEQMDQVMLPIMEADPNAPFDSAIWEVLLEG